MKKILKDLTPAGIFKMTTFMDKIFFFLLIIITTASFFLVKEFIKSGNIVKVSLNNKTQYVLSLTEDKIVSVEGLLGDNVIEIKDGKVHMKDAPCPDKLCIHQGWIDRGAIVCLPNKVVVSVSGDEGKKEFDAVTR